jgi:CRP/FNR family transcriptional activator FtrB
MPAACEVPIFATLPSRAANRIRASVSINQIAAQTRLFEEGTRARALYVLLDGLVQLFTTCEGRETSVLLLRPTTSFPAEAVIGEGTLCTSARAVRTSRIARIAAPAARLLFRSHRGFADVVMEDLASMHRDSIQELKHLRTRTTLQRLVAWLLAMEERSGLPGEVELPYPKAVLAERLGMSPETLSRDLARLADLGISIEGRRCRIGDVTALRRSIAMDHVSKPPVP